MKYCNEKMAALLKASNLVFDKGFDLDLYMQTIWSKAPESTRIKWRKRADVFSKIVNMEVAEYD